MKSGWEIKNLGEVCEFRNGQAHEKYITENGKYKLINSKFISTEGNIFKNTDKALSPLFVDDIVFVMSDVPNGKALAKCFLVDKNDTYTLNQRIGAVNSRIFDPKFLYYQLNRNNYLLSFDNGENQTNLRKDDILKCPLVIPPISEQKHIVKVLDEATATTNKAKENVEKNLSNVRELFESYLQNMFLQKGRDWKKKKLGEVCKKITDGTHQTPTYFNEGFIFLSSKNVTSGKVDWENVKYIDSTQHQEMQKRVAPQTNDILLAKNGTTGIAAIVDRDITFDIYVSLALLRPLDFIYPPFLLHFINSPLAKIQFNQRLKGIGVPNLHLEEIREVEISYPPISVQKSIVEQLDTLSSETKRLERNYNQKIAYLDELKQSILKKALSGEL